MDLRIEIRALNRSQAIS